MAGVQFDIEIDAQNLGGDATEQQLAALVERIQQTNTVATQFDKVVAAARSRLTETSAAAQLAAAALGSAETRYKELEGAANRAAKAVEKAAAAGKDTAALQVAAESAVVAMREQASAVDLLRTKALSASASQTKLAESLKVLEGQQASAAAAIKKNYAAADAANKQSAASAAAAIKTEAAATAARVAAFAKQQKATSAATAEMQKAAAPVDRFASAADAIGAKGPLEKLKKFANGFGLVAGGSLLAAVGVVAFVVATVGAVAALAKFAVASNPKAMERLTAAQDKAKKGFTALFTGVKLDKFIGALEDVMSIFDEGTSTANAMKAIVETILQPLFDAAATAGPLVKEMFKGMIYGALRVVNAVLSLRNEIWKSMSPQTRAQIKSVTDAIFTVENAFTVGEIAAVSLVAIFGLLAATLGVLAVVAALASIPFFLMLLPLVLITAAIVYFDEIVSAVGKTLSGWVTSASNAANDVINGIVNGIKSGAGRVWQAMKDMASNAIKGFTDTFKIGSPSKVMELQGNWIAEGAAEGIDGGATKVQSALESMVSPGDVGASGPTGSTSSSSRAVHIQELHINAAGGDAESIVAAVKRALLEVMEGATLTVGGGEAAA